MKLEQTLERMGEQLQQIISSLSGKEGAPSPRLLQYDQSVLHSWQRELAHYKDMAFGPTQGWTKAIALGGKEPTYYFNILSLQVTWDMPPEMADHQSHLVDEPVPGKSREALEDILNKREELQREFATMLESLSKGDFKSTGDVLLTDAKSGRPYYYNWYARSTSFAKPHGMYRWRKADFLSDDTSSY